MPLALLEILRSFIVKPAEPEKSDDDLRSPDHARTVPGFA